jgi:hypothetical protein
VAKDLLGIIFEINFYHRTGAVMFISSNVFPIFIVYIRLYYNVQW